MSDDQRSSSMKRTIAIKDARIRELSRQLSAERDKSDALQGQISDLETKLARLSRVRGYNP